MPPSPGSQGGTQAARQAGGSPAAGSTPTPRSAPALSRKARAAAAQNAEEDKELPANAPIATSPSFTMLGDGKSRVFVEVSRSVDVTERKAEGRLIYKLKGAAVPLRNSRLPLLTGFFATPVGRVELVSQGDGADLVIDLRELAEPTHQVIETPRGITLQVDFPPSATPRGATLPKAGATKQIAPRDEIE